MQDLTKDPFMLFKQWYAEATHLPRYNTMALATASPNGVPSARTIILAQHSSSGFAFYTSLATQKAQDLAQNPFAEIVFYWSQLERQVRISGSVVFVPELEAKLYFESLSFGSRIRAHAGQGQIIEGREVLENRIVQLTALYEGKNVPMPENWGGFLVVPKTFEFLQIRPDNFHDRFRYVLTPEGTWNIDCLMP